MISPTVAVLHAGQAVTLATYLVRVVAYLLAFAGIAVTVYWSVRAFEVVRSAVDRRLGPPSSDP